MTVNYDPAAMRARLKAALEAQNMSMRRASLESDLSATFAYGVIEQGKDPSTGNLQKLCNTLGVSMPYIMYGFDLDPDDLELLKKYNESPQTRDAILALLPK